MASKVYSKNNMSSSDVKKMQTALKKQGYYSGAIDGIWGSGTSQGLSQYKKATGGSNTYGNTVGNETFKKLYPQGNSGGSSATAKSSATKPSPTYVVRAGETGAYADIVNKAQAYLSDGLYDYIPGAQIDTKYWGELGGKASMYGNNNTYKGNAMTLKDFQTAAGYANAYDQMIEQQKQQQLLAQQQEMQQYYDQMFAQQQAQYAANQAAVQQRTQATIDSINANRYGIDNEFEKAQKENYINRILQQNQMEDYLAAMGYSGGMAESTLQGIASNYENNRQSALAERDSAMRQIDRLVAEAQTSGNSDLTDTANNYYDAYVNALQQQAQMNYQIAADRQAQQNADREYEFKLAQNRWNQQVYQDELAASKASEQEKLAQQIAANDFDAFLNTYKGKYNKAGTYRQWIEKLQKQNDPYGYNKQKIMYLTQYLNGMNANTRKTVSEQSAEGDPSGAVQSAVSSVDNIQKMAQAYASGQVPYALGAGASIGADGPEQAISYLESMIKKGVITEKQARQIAANLGL